jgi:hypothetical protein
VDHAVAGLDVGLDDLGTVDCVPPAWRCRSSSADGGTALATVEEVLLDSRVG